MTDRAVLPQPVAEEVLPVLDTEWRSTQDVMNRWLGRGNERLLSRVGRDRVRAELFFVLDRLFVTGRVQKHQVSENHCTWRKRAVPYDEDRYTNTEADAAEWHRVHGPSPGEM